MSKVLTCSSLTNAQTKNLRSLKANELHAPDPELQVQLKPVSGFLPSITFSAVRSERAMDEPPPRPSMRPIQCRSARCGGRRHPAALSITPLAVVLVMPLPCLRFIVHEPGTPDQCLSLAVPVGLEAGAVHELTTLIGGARRPGELAPPPWLCVDHSESDPHRTCTRPANGTSWPPAAPPR